jgi:uncharacterized protein (UPF0335 family)
MNIARRIQELEEAAYRQGFDAASARMAERLRTKSEAELTAFRAALEVYCTTGKALPGLLEQIKELTSP